jgi:DNA adenine methylase
VLTEPDALCSRIERAQLTVQFWQKQKRLARRNHRRRVDSHLSVGFAAFFLNRCNRSGVFNGGPIGGLDQRGNYKIDARFNKADLIARIQRVALYRDRVRLCNVDAIRLLRGLQRNRATNPSRTFVYLDPPFYHQGPRLYNFAFKSTCHKRLADFLNNEMKLKWMVSYDDCADIHNIYRKQARNVLNMNYQVHTRRLGRELVITSMDCELPEEFFEPNDQKCEVAGRYCEEQRG